MATAIRIDGKAKAAELSEKITEETAALARDHGIPGGERRVSLAEFHSADEVFTTGTMGELAPVVEIDRRIWDLSIEYFNMDPATNVIIDDARHYIKVSDKTYDIIVFDTFLSESVPEHLLTREGFADAQYGVYDSEKTSLFSAGLSRLPSGIRTSTRS